MILCYMNKFGNEVEFILSDVFLIALHKEGKREMKERKRGRERDREKREREIEREKEDKVRK